MADNPTTPDAPTKAQLINRINGYMVMRYGKGLSDGKVSRVLEALDAVGCKVVQKEISDVQ